MKADEDHDLAAPPPIPRRLALGAALALAAIAALAALDLLEDATAGVTLRHALIEGAIVVLATAGAFALGREGVRQRARAHAAELAAAGLIHDVARARADAERWRHEAGALLRGLSEAIEHQLTAWGLTEAEQAIARLLLKGLSHKEIAELRGASDATVRQQAATIYRKSGLAGRAELAAFFLEDLLAPAPPPPARSSAPS